MTVNHLITYTELLTRLEESQPNHLLLGNGFNNSLGIKTNYSEIFARMKREYSGYEKVEAYLTRNDYDIEKLISYLKGKVRNGSDSFLAGYIERKVKLDFMNATNDIVQKSIKKVYQEKNDGIHLLLKNFTNYFTLNYDPFLYLLLLKFKKEDNDQESGNALALQNTLDFIEEDLDTTCNQIYTKIKSARQHGQLQTTIDGNRKDKDLCSATKRHFIATVKDYFKQEGWTSKDIEEVCKQIWKEENNQPVLEVSDGFLFGEFSVNHPQNLYFLHGAFHLVQNGQTIEKIESKQNKAFCQRLEEAIHNEDKEIICVLTNENREKEQSIEQNAYLNKCFNELSKIDGSLVLLGSSLAENDKHIFDKIIHSSVNDIYVSSCKNTEKTDYETATGIFKGKQVTLFDYKTISYSGERE